MKRRQPTYGYSATGELEEYWCSEHQDCMTLPELSRACWESRVEPSFRQRARRWLTRDAA